MQLFSQLRHENIVNYVSIAVDGSRALFVIMEYVAGGSLREVLSRFGGSLDPLHHNVIRRFAVDIVHCDIKPHNVLLSVDGVVKLADFGSAMNRSLALEDSARSPEASFGVVDDGEVHHMRGTAWYMAPEVANGEEHTPASDVWSFGITILELLTGKIPWSTKQRFRNNELRFIRELATGSMLPACLTEEGNRSIPSEIRSMVSRCLEHDPSKRPSCDELLDTEFAL